jgi:Glycosyl transferase family 2
MKPAVHGIGVIERRGGVSVALPVHHAGPGLRSAFRSIADQTLADIEILLIANGCDARTRSMLEELASEEPRARVIERSEPNLAAALNAALHEARHEFVARMDADDTCAPDRLERQAAFLQANPRVGAVVTGWETVDDLGERIAMPMPTESSELRWRLLLSNPIAHGSAMLRTSAVLAAGGYDPACIRAQDYDLWLRLSERFEIGVIPEVLYSYRTRHAGGREGSVAEQARTAARSLIRAWTRLPAGDEDRWASIIAPVIGGATSESPAMGSAERALRDGGPTLAGLIARLWLSHRSAERRQDTRDICRRARLREVARQIKHSGARSVWIWGAGRHTTWLIDHRADLGLPIAGVVDDLASGQSRGGFEVDSPSVLNAGDYALISSDGFEEQIWRSSATYRQMGVRVFRLYAENSPEQIADLPQA